MTNNSLLEKKRTHLIYLKKQHRDLDEGIVTAFKMHTKDNVVSKLKLKKLHLKEEISHLEEELEEHN
jgi:hypothetical protein|tara:strand:- start:57 stop:257 length:201 start_codon:yes stop_codon:yes gene_type:complete